MAQTTKKRRRKKRKSTGAVPLLLVLLGLLLVLLLGIRMLFRSGQDLPEETAASSPSVTLTLPPSELTAECFGTVDGFKTYQSDTITGAIGIDVSSHQGYIDWPAVAASGVDYAIIRAGFRGYSDGGTNEDECFRDNIQGALDSGLDVGVYFFSQALDQEEAVAEAQEVLDMVSGYDLRYPIYFDWEPIEDPDARTATISATELTQCAQAFCSTIEEAGYEAGVYFNLSLAMGLYHLYELKDYDFWLAEYQDIPSYPFAIDMWQYTNEGTVPGISTDVDLNLSFQENPGT